MIVIVVEFPLLEFQPVVAHVEVLGEVWTMICDLDICPSLLMQARKEALWSLLESIFPCRMAKF